MASGNILLTYNGSHWVCQCRYEERHIPKNARFYWVPRARLWVTTSARCASLLMEYADVPARQAIIDKLAYIPRESAYSHARVKSSYRYNA